MAWCRVLDAWGSVLGFRRDTPTYKLGHRVSILIKSIFWKCVYLKAGALF